MHPQATIVLLGGAAERRDALARGLQQLARRAKVAIVLQQQTVLNEATGGPHRHLLLHPSIDGERWREQLALQGCDYSALHGDERAQLAAAWALAAPMLGLSPVEASAVLPAQPQRPARLSATWRCDKCSDPECEHRLFRDLIARREGDQA